MPRPNRTSSPQAPAELITARRAALALRRDYRDLLTRLVLIALVAWIAFSQVFLLMQNRGQDMFPAVKDGDLVIAYRLQRDYEKNDLVVYLRNGEHCVGRIAARAGDYVNITEDGALLVNGTVQSGEIVYPTYPKENIVYPYAVPDGTVFILADYRTQAQDSRDFGPVETKDIEAKVLSLLRRRGL